MVSLGPSTWSSYKKLLHVVNLAVFGRSPDVYHDLESLLHRHKAAFLTLAQRPPKNMADREEVKNASTVGVAVSDKNSPLKLDQDFVRETLELSNALDINEKAALELMLVAEEQLPRFPDYTRQQVAILLHQDGRQSVFSALRALVQAREGNSWLLELNPQVSRLVMVFTDELFENGLVGKCLAQLGALSPLRETEQMRAAGSFSDGRLLQEVSDLVVEQRNMLADTLFYWTCQQPFYSGETLQLISYLKKEELSSSTHLDHVTVALFSALIQCFTVGDLLSWQQRNDDEPDERYPITSQYPGFVRDVHREMMKAESGWAWPGLGAAAQFCWAVLLRECSKIALFSGTPELDDDDRLVLAAMRTGGLKFLRGSYICTPHFQQEDLYSKRLHAVLTSFIVHMHLKVKEMSYNATMEGDGARPLAQTSGKHAGILEDFLLLLGDLYGNEQLGEELSLEFWCVPEGSELVGRSHHSSHRQLSLLRFLYTCCDVLQGAKSPASIFLSFLHLLRGLAGHPRSANFCHMFLSPSPSHGLGGIYPQRAGGVVSWDHFFVSIKQYFAVLRQDAVNSRSGISPSELEGLQAVLQLSQTIVSKDKVARVQLYENPTWSLVQLLFGLVSCPVPCKLKAEVFGTLTAFAKTPEIASQMWTLVEMSQIVQSIPATSTPKPRTMPPGKQQGFTPHQTETVGNIQVELEEVESQEGEYGVTRSFLALLHALLAVPLPLALGHPHRRPGFDPYLIFLVDSVFMKFDVRAYKDPAEKWKVSAAVLEILHKLLRDYTVVKEDFIIETSREADPRVKHPGFTLLVHMMKESKFLMKVLQVLEGCVKVLEERTSLHDPPDVNMERTVLLCLQMIETTLRKQSSVIEEVRSVGGGVRVEGVGQLHQLLLHVAGTPQHIMNIVRCVALLHCSPELALSAVKILQGVATYDKAVSELVFHITGEKDKFKRVLHGFVERLEVAIETPSSSNNHDDDPSDLARDSPATPGAVQGEIKEAILRLMLLSVERPAPNLAHLLLGYNTDSTLAQTELQNPGVMGCSYTLLHSIISLLRPMGRSLSFASVGTSTSTGHSHTLKELAYCLLYNLCSHGDLAGPTLRYLRNSFNFFVEYLRVLPFPEDSSTHLDPQNDALVQEMRSSQPNIMTPTEVAILRQQAWLLKTVAIELRITSKKSYISQTNQILSLLLSDQSTDGIESEDSDPMSFGNLPFVPQMGGVQNNAGQPCVSKLLTQVEFSELDFPFQLQLQNFEVAIIEQLLPRLQEKDPLTGVVQINIRHLHQLLLCELNQMPSLSVEQRASCLGDIHHILLHCLARNIHSSSAQARGHYFEGWRQVVEVMLTVDTADQMKGANRVTLIMALLQDLLLKLNSDRVSPSLASSAQGLLVTLLSHLRQGTQPDRLSRDSAHQVLRPGSLQSVLRGICDSILKSSSTSGSAMTRACSYASLLFYLQLSKAYSRGENPVSIDPAEEGAESVEMPWAGYGDRESLVYSNMAVLYGYSEALVDMICRDASSGHDVSKMLALSLLDSVVAMDAQGRWMHLLKAREYLRNLTSTVCWEDESLQKSLLLVPEHLRSLYVYESKMAFLSRVAMRPDGAKALLDAKALLHLSDCKFIDSHPGYHDATMETGLQSFTARTAGKPSSMEYGGFIPSLVERYHQLLFPILRLMSSLLGVGGAEYRTAAMQVMMFIEGHVDTFVAILHHGNSPASLQALRELAHVTMVIARAGVGYDTVVRDPAHFNPVSLVRIQTAMRGLLGNYWSVANWKTIIARLMESEAPETGGRSSLEKEASVLLQKISGHLAFYCRVDMTIAGEELTSQSGRILFSPALTAQPSSNLASMKGALPLATIVGHLRECTDRFPTLSEELLKLEHKLESDSGLDDHETLAVTANRRSNIPMQDRVLLAKESLRRQVDSLQKERKLHCYIIENLLYVLWRHLHFYLVYCRPSDFADELIFKGGASGTGLRSLTGGFSAEESGRGAGFGRGRITHDISNLPDRVTQMELDRLREDLPAALNDQLFQKLLDLEENYIQADPSVRVSFVQAVVRRLKRLIAQFGTGRQGQVL